MKVLSIRELLDANGGRLRDEVDLSIQQAHRNIYVNAESAAAREVTLKIKLRPARAAIGQQSVPVEVRSAVKSGFPTSEQSVPAQVRFTGEEGERATEALLLDFEEPDFLEGQTDKIRDVRLERSKDAGE